MYPHTPTYSTYSVHSRDPAALHFTQNHQGTTVENDMKQDTKLSDGRGPEGKGGKGDVRKKIKWNNGSTKWKHTKQHQKKKEKPTAAMA